MNAYRVLASAVALALAAGAGWMAHHAVPAPPGPAFVAAAAQPRAAKVGISTAALAAQPLIAVSSDGNVTLRVEQQPLQWVLEQIADQTGWTELKAITGSVHAAASAVARPAAEPVAMACPEAPPPVNAANLLNAIERGAETDRYEGLLAARSEGVTVAERTLKTLFETDASERVRVAAFEGWLQYRADSRETLRQALESALNVPSAAVQREARQRLDELDESARIDALSMQGGS